MTSSFYGSPDRPFQIDVYKTKLLNLEAYVSVNPDPTDKKVCLPIGQVLYGQTKIEGKLGERQIVYRTKRGHYVYPTF